MVSLESGKESNEFMKNIKAKLNRGYVVVLAVVTIVIFHAGFAATAIYVIKPLFHRLETERANGGGSTVTNLPPKYTFLPTNYPWAPIGNGLIAMEIPDEEAQKIFNEVSGWTVESSTNLVDWSYSIDVSARQQELQAFLGGVMMELSTHGSNGLGFFKFE